METPSLTSEEAEERGMGPKETVKSMWLRGDWAMAVICLPFSKGKRGSVTSARTGAKVPEAAIEPILVG